ncbi:exopolysaccharide biosynthesis protein [uncultured Microbulbifer sp.]|uniref:exopolysaccharide biosynthesis protein n=1 Tax=uncultured Microbulbifer sp. TaxID=348147 RepID=UPI00262C1946|nr:exopolysaccharide biosynthesis protein [uncultured Microbulbifer sp.]
MKPQRPEMQEEIRNLTQLLFQLEQGTRAKGRVSLAQVLEALGQRSFAPLLLVAGLILFSPLSGIPGVPTLMGLLILLTSVQMLMLRRHLWLPQWLLRKSIAGPRFHRALRWLQRPASFIDRWLKPRLPALVHRVGTYLTALLCTAIAAALPVMELLPFSATIAGLALTAFGLALVAQDGLVALLALAVMGSLAGLAMLTWV